MPLRWEKLPEYTYDEMTVGKVQELAEGLQPFAVTGVVWDGMGVWADMRDVAGDDEEADVMLFLKETVEKGGVVPDMEDTTLAKDAFDLLEAHSGDGTAVYVKYPVLDGELLESLPFKNLFTDTELTPVPLPLLLKPNHYFTWLYAGHTGTGSKTHIDILNSSAWLTLLTGSKKWLLIHGADHDTSPTPYPDLFSAYNGTAPHSTEAALSKCRLYAYDQSPTTAIFVPPKCIHSVRNTTTSVSLTHNFVDKATQHHWESAIKELMGV